MKIILLREKGSAPLSVQVDRWTLLMFILFLMAISMIIGSVLNATKTQVDYKYTSNNAFSISNYDSSVGGIAGDSIEPNLKHIDEASLLESIRLSERKLQNQNIRLNIIQHRPSNRIKFNHNAKSTFGTDTDLNFPKLHSMPVDVGYISSKYGMRIDPINGKYQKHNGIDIAAKKGSVIRAIGSGFVTFSGRKGGYGNVIEIHHSDSLKSRYAHLDKILVKEGAVVRKSSEIAKMGRTGRATGSHLHLEVWLNGVSVNPEKYLGTLNGFLVNRVVSN